MAPSLVFFGSSDFSVPVLQKLIDRHIVPVAVVTTPDKPVGRHLNLTPNPVKVLAQKYHLPVFESHRDLIENYKLKIENLVGLVAAYGRIIPPELLSKFNNRIFNIHPSLLPKYRGPSPLQQQILDGVSDTGATIICLDNEIDHGPIVAQTDGQITPVDTPPTLGDRLFALGTDLFVDDVLLKINNLKLKIQNDAQATFTKKLTRQDGFILYEELMSYLKTENYKLKIERIWRAYYPWPGVWTLSPEGKRIKLVSINPVRTLTS
jgi:methionyl-tRNA formyltransferase